MNQLLNPLRGEELDMPTAVTNFKKWIAYQPYVKVMSVVDMFLNEFPYHAFAQARVGTIVTRFKDCSALISTRTITQCLSVR